MRHEISNRDLILLGGYALVTAPFRAVKWAAKQSHKHGLEQTQAASAAQSMAHEKSRLAALAQHLNKRELELEQWAASLKQYAASLKQYRGDLVAMQANSKQENSAFVSSLQTALRDAQSKNKRLEWELAVLKAYGAQAPKASEAVNPPQNDGFNRNITLTIRKAYGDDNEEPSFITA